MLLKLRRFPNQCGVSDSCANYFSNFRYITSSSIFSSVWSTNAVFGYNLVYFTTPIQATKGMLIYIKSEVGALAIDASGNAPYTDYLVNNNYLTPLNNTRNHAIYIRCIFSNPFYSSVIHFGFISSNQFGQTVRANFLGMRTNVTRIMKSEQFIDIFCYNSNQTIDRTINCSIVLASLSSTDQFFIEDGQNQTQNFGNEHSLRIN